MLTQPGPRTRVARLAGPSARRSREGFEEILYHSRRRRSQDERSLGSLGLELINFAMRAQNRHHSFRLLSWVRPYIDS